MLPVSVLLHKSSNKSSNILIHKPLSATSFGCYWKQLIRRPYIHYLFWDQLIKGTLIQYRHLQTSIIYMAKYFCLFLQVEPIPSKPPRSFATSSTGPTSSTPPTSSTGGPTLASTTAGGSTASSPPESTMSTNSLVSPMQQSMTSPSSTISSSTTATADSPSSPLPSARAQTQHQQNLYNDARHHSKR